MYIDRAENLFGVFGGEYPFWGPCLGNVSLSDCSQPAQALKPLKIFIPNFL